MDTVTLLKIRFSSRCYHRSQRWREAESNHDGAYICQLKAELLTSLADRFLSQKSEEEMRETVLSQKGLEKQKEPGNLGEQSLYRLRKAECRGRTSQASSEVTRWRNRGIGD